MKKLIAILALIPSVAFAQFYDDKPANTANQALIESLLGNANKNNAVAGAVEQRSFIERQNYIETGNIYGDTSNAPARFNFGGHTITGDPLGGAQRKYQVEKFESQQRTNSLFGR